MSVRKNFSRVGQVDILVVHFRLLTTRVQIDVHITLYLCYTTKKMTHVNCNSPTNALRWQQCFFSHRIKLVGSNTFFSFHIVCFFAHRDLVIAISSRCLAAYLPQMSAFNSHVHQNVNCRNFEPLLPCYCYAIKANFKTILPPSFATCLCRQCIGFSELQAHQSSLHDARTVNPALVQCECHTGKWNCHCKN